jgi:hypothetical protein
MRGRILLGALPGLLLALGLLVSPWRLAWAQADGTQADITQPAETPEVLPPGEAREEVFYACTACHSTAVIRRSRLGRQQWDDLMDWMTEKHGMNPLEGEQRRQIVDYLATAFPASSGRRRAGNPFLTD